MIEESGFSRFELGRMNDQAPSQVSTSESNLVHTELLLTRVRWQVFGVSEQSSVAVSCAAA